MENNAKKSQTPKWHFNILNRSKKFKEPKEGKEVTKETDKKLEISQSSKSSLTNLFRKFSIRSNKNTSSKTAPSGGDEKEPTKMQNSPINTRSVNGTKAFYINNNLSDFVTEKFTDLNLNGGSTGRKKSTLQKCINKSGLFDKKDFDNSEKAICFDKNIKVEESEDIYDIASNAARSKSKFTNNNNKVKSENTKTGSVDTFSYHLRTTSCNNKVKIEDSGKLLNTDFDVYGLGSKDIEIEEINELVSKSEITPATFKEGKFNNSDFHQSSSKHSKNLDFKSVSHRDDHKDAVDEDIIERNPIRNLNNRGTQRVYPYNENHAFNQELQYSNMGNYNAEDIAKREADEIIDSYLHAYRRQELEYVSSCLQCNMKIIAQIEADHIIDCLVETYKQQDSEIVSLGSNNPEYICVSEELEKYIEIELVKGGRIQDDLFSGRANIGRNGYDFSKADEVLASRNAVIPQSECGSPSFQLEDFSDENEKAEQFCDEIKNSINNFFPCNDLVPDYLPNSKNGYWNAIASKDQLNCNYELKTKARNKLVNAAAFSKDKCRKELSEMFEQIKTGQFGTKEDKGIIHKLKPEGKEKYKRTNLHVAVMDGNLENTFCIVEVYKQLHGHITFGINACDNKGKTVLDRVKENNMSLANDLLKQYLEENNAKPAIHHMQRIRKRPVAKRRPGKI